MMATAAVSKKHAAAPASMGNYRLEDQAGFLLRKASQRHTAIFASRMIGELTPTQWAALVKIDELGSVSQNQLGRDTAMDAATIKGVVDRLMKRNLVVAKHDPADGRRSLISLTAEGAGMVRQARPIARAITSETLDGLTAAEQAALAGLLRKIG